MLPDTSIGIGFDQDNAADAKPGATNPIRSTAETSASRQARRLTRRERRRHGALLQPVQVRAVGMSRLPLSITWLTNQREPNGQRDVVVDRVEEIPECLVAGQAGEDQCENETLAGEAELVIVHLPKLWRPRQRTARVPADQRQIVLAWK
jgi:hypothetical protein